MNIEYLVKLLDDSYFKQQIDSCKDTDSIYKITQYRKHAIQLKKYIESQKPIEPYDEIPEATDTGKPIEVELTDEQLDYFLNK